MIFVKLFIFLIIFLKATANSWSLLSFLRTFHNTMFCSFLMIFLVNSTLFFQELLKCWSSSFSRLFYLKSRFIEYEGQTEKERSFMGLFTPQMAPKASCRPGWFHGASFSPPVWLQAPEHLGHLLLLFVRLLAQSGIGYGAPGSWTSTPQWMLALQAVQWRFFAVQKCWPLEGNLLEKHF